MVKIFFFSIFLVTILSCTNDENHRLNSDKQTTQLNTQDISGVQKKEMAAGFYSVLNRGNDFSAHGAMDSARIYLDSALSVARMLRNDTFEALTYLQLGGYFDNAGDYNLSLECEFKALDLFEKIKDSIKQIEIMNNISWVYIQSYNFEKGIDICKRGIAKLNTSSFGPAKTDLSSYLYNNLAIAYLECNRPDSALKYNTLAQTYLSNNAALYIWIMAEFGCIYEHLKDFARADEYFGHSLKYKDYIQQSGATSFALSKYCHFLNNRSRYQDAIHYGKFGIDQARRTGMKKYIIDIANELLVSYENTHQTDSAFKYARMAMNYQDSVFNERKSIQIQSMAFTRDLRDREVQHRIENFKATEKVTREQKLRNLFLAGFVLVFLFAGILLFQRNKIKAGKRLSDDLLLNILPGEVAEELKIRGSSEPTQFDSVTVMFTDFKGFTEIAEKLSAKELVNEIHTCFMAFDNIIGKHNIEKIKTIGDSYMCVGGLPAANNTHASDVVKAALEIQQFMLNREAENSALGKVHFQIRIGIHTGPVVAGIVGIRKYAYDIWGDTVNTASRMESSGEAGKVNISGTTYELVKDQFSCTHRGKIQAKNKGELDMYFVEGKI